jgi:hypothetical protein
MTMQEAKDKLTDAVDGSIARVLRSLALAAILGLSGWELLTTSEHSADLAAIREKVTNLVAAVEGRNAATELRLGRIVEAEGALRDDVTRLQDGLADVQDAREREGRQLIPRRVPAGGP